MTVSVREKIPKEKFQQFMEILKATGGRLEYGTIIEERDGYYVAYETDNYERHCKAWRMVTEDVKEIRRDTKLHVMARKLHLEWLVKLIKK